MFDVWLSPDTLRLARDTYCAYAHNVSIMKNPLNRSFLSEIQTTDWTCNGWRSNNAATRALRQTACVICRNTMKSSSVFAM